MIDARYIQIIRHSFRRMFQFVSFRTGKYCSYLVSLITFWVLARVFGFWAASTLLMKRDPRLRFTDLMMQEISYGKRLFIDELWSNFCWYWAVKGLLIWLSFVIKLFFLYWKQSFCKLYKTWSKVTEGKRTMSFQSIAIKAHISEETERPSNDNRHEGILVEKTVYSSTHQKYANWSSPICLWAMFHNQNDLS